MSCGNSAAYTNWRHSCFIFFFNSARCKNAELAGASRLSDSYPYYRHVAPISTRYRHGVSESSSSSPARGVPLKFQRGVQLSCPPEVATLAGCARVADRCYRTTCCRFDCCCGIHPHKARKPKVGPRLPLFFVSVRVINLLPLLPFLLVPNLLGAVSVRLPPAKGTCVHGSDLASLASPRLPFPRRSRRPCLLTAPLFDFCPPICCWA